MEDRPADLGLPLRLVRRVSRANQAVLACRAGYGPGAAGHLRAERAVGLVDVGVRPGIVRNFVELYVGSPIGHQRTNIERRPCCIPRPESFPTSLL